MKYQIIYAEKENDMKYRAFGLEMRHVEVDVEASTAEEAARKAYQSFKDGNSEEGYSDEPWYDEDIELAPYNDGDYELSKAEILNGSTLK